MNNLTTFYIVRHAESEGNANFDKKIKVEISIRGGTFLTEKGKKQAKKIAERLKDIHFDAIYSSDLNRAKETAEAIALKRKIPVRTTEIIRERSFSSYLKQFPQKTYDELVKEIRRDLDQLDDDLKLNYKHSPKMESADEQATRILNFLREVASTYPDKTILVVNHGNNMRSMLTKLGYAKFDELPTGSIENTGYIVLESDGVDFFLKETHGVTKQQGVKRTF